MKVADILKSVAFCCGGCLAVLGTHLTKKKEIGGKLHSWLHLWITGFQDAQAKPFKPGYHFAAVNAAKRNKNKGYRPAGLGQN